ncbi:hypothetical protein [Catellatospora sichuanensis]|uniref:hypothetical protein n=1 Tax=Catellatospora sichuanensis TaxID=1969805 RepID=UPI001C925D6F|nr:hypothetical protein [Catellatospora sichuanensis]
MSRVSPPVTFVVDFHRTREQHLAILDAITARRPEVAQSWALIHVAGVEEWLRRAR